MKKILCLFFAIYIFILSVNASSAVSWYCQRNSDHKQPPLGADIRPLEEYDLYWCDKKHTEYDSDEKVIYLTFDAGYENGNVERILNVLKEENVTAAFFVLSNLILSNEDLVRRMIEDGHIVANHTSKHKDITKYSSKEQLLSDLETIEQLYFDTYGVEMAKYFRPPEGKLSKTSLSWVKELGYKTVMWSFAYADWDNNNQPKREGALKKIYDNIHNGSVILLHPTSSTNADILQEVITKLKKDGFRFGTLDELCND